MIDYWGRVRSGDREALEITPDRLHAPGRAPVEGALTGRTPANLDQYLPLMARPELLILDEPCTGGLDPVAREHFLQFLERRLTRKNWARSGAGDPSWKKLSGIEASYALLLKAGCVLAAGKRGAILKDETLSEAFGETVRIRRRNGRVNLVLAPAASKASKPQNCSCQPQTFQTVGAERDDSARTAQFRHSYLCIWANSRTFGSSFPRQRRVP